MKSRVEKTASDDVKEMGNEPLDFPGLLKDAGLGWRHRENPSADGWDDAGFVAFAAAHTTNDLDWRPPPIDDSDGAQILETLEAFQGIRNDLQRRGEAPRGGDRRRLLKEFGELVQEPYFWGHRIYGQDGETLERLFSEIFQIPRFEISSAAVEITYIGRGLASATFQWKAGSELHGWAVFLVRSDSGRWKIKVLTEEDRVRGGHADGEEIHRLLETWYAIDHTGRPDEFLLLTTGGAHCIDPRSSYLLSRKKLQEMERPGDFCDQFLEQMPLRHFDDENFRGTAVTDVRPLYLGEDFAVVTHRGQSDGDKGEIFLSNSAAMLLRHEGKWRVSFIVFHYAREASHSSREQIRVPAGPLDPGPLPAK